MAKINAPLMEAVMAENNPSYEVSLENKLQDLYNRIHDTEAVITGLYTDTSRITTRHIELSKRISLLEEEVNRRFNLLEGRWNWLEKHVGSLAEVRVDVLEKGPAAEAEPERKTGWAIICSIPDMPFIFCGRDGFQLIRRVRDVFERHGARWVVWFDTREDAEQCIKLAQLGDDCKVVQLDRETLEEVEAGE